MNEEINSNENNLFEIVNEDNVGGKIKFPFGKIKLP